MDVGKAMTNVACIGECMVELRQAHGGQAGQSAGQGGGLYSRGFGGDTLNTAVYLARLETRVDYLTALGDDAQFEPLIAELQSNERVRQLEATAIASQFSGPTPKSTTRPKAIGRIQERHTKLMKFKRQTSTAGRSAA